MGLIAPITLVERTSPSLVRKGSVKGAITSVCALSGSKVKESLSSVISLEFVKTCEMTLKIDYFTFDPLKAQTLVIAPLTEPFLNSDRDVRTKSVIGDSRPNGEKHLPLRCW